MSVDDAIRTALERTVQPIDADAVLTALERRRVEQRRTRRRSRLLAAAAAAAVIGAGVAVARVDPSPDRVVTGPTEEAVPVNTPTVHASSTGLGPLLVSTTELRPSRQGWLEHTVTVENTGTQTVHVNDHRTAQFLGDREVLVTDEGCGPGWAPGEAVSAMCQQDLRPFTLDPGQREHFVMVLWRGLEGMSPVSQERLVHRKPLVFRVAPESDRAEQAGADGELVLTYEHLGGGGWILPAPHDGAAAEQLYDGTPVWVVRHDDDSVSVLDAVSTHMPFGAGTLLGWCEQSRGFEDPMHGSQFDEWGTKRGGPAPSGLLAYPSSVDGDTVVVTRPATARDRPDGADDGSVGADCSGSDGGTLRLHSVDRLQRISLDQAMARPDGAFELVAGASILLEQDGPARVCATVWTSSPPACLGPEAPGLSLFDNREWALLTGDFVARVRDGSLTEISFVDSYRVEGPGD